MDEGCAGFAGCRGCAGGAHGGPSCIEIERTLAEPKPQPPSAPARLCATVAWLRATVLRATVRSHASARLSRRKSRERLRALAVALASALLFVSPIAATAQSGSLRGVVVDAGSGAGLAGVAVTIEPAPGGLLAPGSRGAGLAAVRSVETNASGAYRFGDLVAGRYRLRVERLGYRVVTIDVEIRQPLEARVSVALEMAPVELEAVHVEDEALPPFRRVAGGPSEPEEARVYFERERQMQFLTSDARALTYADMIEGITLGETDVFRALQRFPGVATRDDYTAELWTRGAPWAQTRVTFDGLPLFNPVHAVGVFSGVAPEILGGVFFHPGVRPAALGEGAAGVVDLRSRPGSGEGDLRGAADISLASARLSLDQRPSERFAWIVSGRRSYLDVFTNGLDWFGIDDLDLPYAFHDVAARLDAQISNRSGIEASGIWEDDRLYGNVDGILEETTANWGNAAGRVTLHAPLGGLQSRHTFGFSRYRAVIRESPDSTILDRNQPWAEPETDNRIAYARFATELEPPSVEGRVAPWTAGYEVVAQHMRYDGPEPRFYPVKPDTTRRISGEGRTWTVAGWADARIQIGTRVTMAPGLRIEGGTRVRNGGSMRLAPRFAVQVRASDRTTISLAAGRSWQYLQALALAGPSAHPAFHASQFWLWAGEKAPAIRADIATIGAEHWFGTGWLGSMTAYRRRATGVTVPDPQPGGLERRPLFVIGENDAHGIELSLRKVAGRWTAALAYTAGESVMHAAGLTFPSVTDRARRIDATAVVRLVGGLRLAGAYAAMTGAPYTRVRSRLREDDCSLFGFECSAAPAQLEAQNVERTPDYRSLDASLTWTRALAAFEVSAYVQVRNVLNRNNASTYSGSVPIAVRTDRQQDIVWGDRFEAGLPRMPLIGARIAF